MTELCTFGISLRAANAVGLLRPNFAANLPVDDCRLTCTVDDAFCRVECSRDIALAIAHALQEHVRSDVTPLAAGSACSAAAAVIHAAVRRFDDDARGDGRTNGGMTSA
jgi:hypothetical protein